MFAEDCHVEKCFEQKLLSDVIEGIEYILYDCMCPCTFI